MATCQSGLEMAKKEDGMRQTVNINQVSGGSGSSIRTIILFCSKQPVQCSMTEQSTSICLNSSMKLACQ